MVGRSRPGVVALPRVMGSKAVLMPAAGGHWKEASSM
jgi:hypothetical protein